MYGTCRALRLLACSGPETPKPTQMALSVASRSDETSPSTRASVFARAPVTPAHQAVLWVHMALDELGTLIQHLKSCLSGKWLSDGAGSLCSDSALKILFLITV